MNGSRMRYVTGVPKVIPDGMVLCHNAVRAQSESQRHGVNGFRLFIEDADKCVECGCGWEPERALNHCVLKTWADRPRGRIVMAPGTGLGVDQ